MKPRMSGIADDAARRGGDRKGVQRDHVAVEPGLLAGSQIEVVDAELASLGEQRIVDVGDVADALDGVPLVDQMALQHVVRDERGGVPEVRGVVWRDPARVHEDVITGLERNDRLARRVVQLKDRHAQPSTTLGSRLIPVSFGATRVL